METDKLRANILILVVIIIIIMLGAACSFLFHSASSTEPCSLRSTNPKRARVIYVCKLLKTKASFLKPKRLIDSNGSTVIVIVVAVSVAVAAAAASTNAAWRSLNWPSHQGNNLKRAIISLRLSFKRLVLCV